MIKQLLFDTLYFFLIFKFFLFGNISKVPSFFSWFKIISPPLVLSSQGKISYELNDLVYLDEHFFCILLALSKTMNDILIYYYDILCLHFLISCLNFLIIRVLIFKYIIYFIK